MSTFQFTYLLLSLAALSASIGFIAGVKHQKRLNSGQLNRMIQELKASSDKLERSVAENTQQVKAE